MDHPVASGRPFLRALVRAAPVAACAALVACAGGPGPAHLSLAPRALVMPPGDLLAGPSGPSPAEASAAPARVQRRDGSPHPPGPPEQAGPRYAVHLASYRTLATLRRGWALLVREDPDDLAGLRPDIARVDLGPEKGIFYRLKAGPLADRGEAERLCRRLKHHGLYCAVMPYTG